MFVFRSFNCENDLTILNQLSRPPQDAGHDLQNLQGQRIDFPEKNVRPAMKHIKSWRGGGGTLKGGDGCWLGMRKKTNQELY